MEETQKDARIRKPVKRLIEGTVISTKMSRTAVVLVKRRVLHPVYKKYYVRGKRYKVHDPEGKCAVGDTVRIIPCRPISKDKRWELQSILGHQAEALAEERESS